MAEWIYERGSADDFEGAPFWATMRTNAGGRSYFFEGSFVGARGWDRGANFEFSLTEDFNASDIAVFAVRKKAEPGPVVFGNKADAGKLRMSLLPLSALNEMLAVLEFGAQKYAPDNWRKVDNLRERYFNAAHRHLSAWWSGERNDSESGLHHLAHCACCIIFLLATDMENK